MRALAAAAALASLVAAACLDDKSGTKVDATDTTTVADTTPDTAPTTDVASDVVTTTAVPVGTWSREIIGDCIHIIEALTFDASGTSASWRVEDDDFCQVPRAVESFAATVTTPGDHIVELELGTSDWLPRRVRWTWAVLPAEAAGGPEVLTTQAFRRVPGTVQWHREERELRGSLEAYSDRTATVDVTLEGYPDVTALVIDFDVAQRYGGRSPDHAGTGSIRYAARREVGSDGGAAIVAEGYTLASAPEHYRFSQDLLARGIDPYVVDLVGQVVQPVLYEVAGDPDALHVVSYGLTWYRIAP